MASLCPEQCSFILRGLHVSSLLWGRREHTSPSAVAAVWVLLWVWAAVLKASPPAMQCVLLPWLVSLCGRSGRLKPGSPWRTCQRLLSHSFKCGRFICCEVMGYSITAGDTKRNGLSYVGCVHFYFFFIYQYNFTTLIIVYFFASARAVTHAMFLSFLHLIEKQKGKTDRSKKCCCLGWALLMPLVLCSWAGMALAVPRAAPGAPWEAGACFGCPCLRAQLTVPYLTTSRSGYEDQLMLKLFGGTRCFMSANYYIQVCYSLGIRSYLGNRWGGCEMYVVKNYK